MATSSTRRSLRFGPAPTRQPRLGAIWVPWMAVGPSSRGLEILPPTPTLPRKGGGGGALCPLRIDERTNFGGTLACAGEIAAADHIMVKLVRLQVLTSVEFDTEMPFGAVEVQNASADRMRAAELQAGKLP